MSLRLKSAAIGFMIMSMILGCAGAAGAASVVGVFPFQNTGASPPSHYGNGSYPASELLQASDGNFYGTTENGGAGSCPTVDVAPRSIPGCGTIFRINAATGAETVLFSFPYDAATGSAPDGAFPSAGLIQGKDGALYGVAQEGGILACDGVYDTSPYGCGTLFRISTSGVFTLLHQFCGSVGCPGVVEGANPQYHLVQAADGTLFGSTLNGSRFDFLSGTLFSATTSGVVKTLYGFQDDDYPLGPLLIGQDGSTLYGADDNGVFSFGAAGLTFIHTFDTSGVRPGGPLIFGPDGLLYGYTFGGSSNAMLYSLDTTGGDFTVDALLPLDATGLLLGSDGMIYGTEAAVFNPKPEGGVFVYNPATKALKPIIEFGTTTGNDPEAALIEGKDRYLYGSNTRLGGSNSFGPAEGTLFRIGPPLP